MAKASFTWGRAAVHFGAVLLVASFTCQGGGLFISNETDEDVLVFTDGLNISVGTRGSGEIPLSEGACLHGIRIRSQDSRRLITTIEGPACQGEVWIVDASGAHKRPRGSDLPQIIAGGVIFALVLAYWLIHRRERQVE